MQEDEDKREEMCELYSLIVYPNMMEESSEARQKVKKKLKKEGLLSN